MEPESLSPDAVSTLFWSKLGAVACAQHAPALGSDVWKAHGWQQVPRWRQGFHSMVLQCQFCHGRPFLHVPRPVESDDWDLNQGPAEQQ